jgi:hypothetical protein
MLKKASAAWLVTTVIAAGPAPNAAQDKVPPPVARVEVFLSVAPGLPDAVRAALIEETTAIWQEHGVSIEWLPADEAREPAINRLRAMIVERRAVKSKEDGPFAVGELVPSTNSHPIALVSIERAEQLVASVRDGMASELVALDEQRLGVVLGRVLAHEIGHFLLNTPTHARNGLMRPRFNAVEFTDLRDGTFSLDQDAAAWLRSGSARRFAYAR